MKNIARKITALIIPLLAVGCTQFQFGFGNGEESSEVEENSSLDSSTTSKSSSSSSSKSSSNSSSTSSVHTHEWAEAWTYDETNHWHVCSGCNEKKDSAAHTLSGWEDTSTSSLAAANEWKGAAAQIRGCQTCSYYELKGDVLPKLYFTAPDVSFATTATKSDLSRPKVAGKITLNNCDEKYQLSEASCTMKVRGNQTAGWAKKGFKIKFDSAKSMLGLHNNKAYKEWILLADAKDTALIRTALGLKISQGICKEDNQVWVSDFTPVSVYLNDQYWGYYYLAEQKEVKTGRVNLPIPQTNYEGVDIGYCFELDHYADAAGSTGEASEIAKGADGDPTFRVNYQPSMAQGRPSGPLATGQVNTYTLLSDITDGPKDTGNNPTEHYQADYTNLNRGQLTKSSQKTSNSKQLSFIRDRVEALYQVLYYAAVEKKANEINDNNQVVASNKTVKQVVEQYFDLDAWVDGYIINAYSCPPDLGYSSFYMSYDNSPTGDKKLRYDVPWDFDSNFGNRNNFITNADELYVDNTYNTWIYLLSKLDFFNTMVKAKWNKLREDKVFEGMFHMMRTYFTIFDSEIQKDHQKWPQNDAAHQPPNNFDEIREPYKDPAKYKQAEAETINWCSKRVNYLEKQWGTGRASINTYA